MIRDRQVVHVWYASLEHGRRYLRDLVTILSPEELDRAALFSFERDRMRFVGRRGVLRGLLGWYLGRHPSNVQLGRQRHGKPHLVGERTRSELRFNAAHSADVVLVAIARGREVGIDVEHLRPVADDLLVAERYFPTAESGELRALPPGERTERFLAYWTRWEAYGKATGEGVGVLDRSKRLGDAWKNDVIEGWTYRLLRQSSDWVGALVVEGSGWTMEYRPVRWDRIVAGLSPSRSYQRESTTPFIAAVNVPPSIANSPFTSE